jgi:protein TonB
MSASMTRRGSRGGGRSIAPLGLSVLLHAGLLAAGLLLVQSLPATAPWQGVEVTLAIEAPAAPVVAEVRPELAAEAVEVPPAEVATAAPEPPPPEPPPPAEPPPVPAEAPPPPVAIAMTTPPPVPVAEPPPPVAAAEAPAAPAPPPPDVTEMIPEPEALPPPEILVEHSAPQPSEPVIAQPQRVVQAAVHPPAPPKPPAPARPAAPRPAKAGPPQPAAAPVAAPAATPAAPPADEGPLLITAPRFRSPPAPPIYPRTARELGQEGEVLVRARLDLAGNPEEVLLARSSGFDMLDRAAMAAVRRWPFEPGRRGGTAVVAWVQIPVRFTLR